MNKATIGSVGDISRDEMQEIFELADTKKQLYRNYKNAASGIILGLLFFQPSTRNRLSFSSSFLRIGGNTVGFSNVEESRSGSSAKESMSDLARVVTSFCDLAVMRTGDAAQFQEFSEACDIPVISAGHGNIEHPTTGMTHLYTLTKLHSNLNGLRVLVFDHSPKRTTNSILLAISLWANVSIDVVSRTDLSQLIIKKCEAGGSKIRQFRTYDEVQQSINLKEYNVLLFDFVDQDEKISELKHHDSNKMFRLTKESIKSFDRDVMIFHPLPRDERIHVEIDELNNAKYFEVIKNANFVRSSIFLRRMLNIR